MGFLIGLLAFILFVNSLFLILLVLVQLPKKDAGLGQAFGGAATEMLFGAGAGNVLTKITKYSATIFLSLCLVLSVLVARDKNSGDRALEKALNAKASQSGGNKPESIVPGIGSDSEELSTGTDLIVPSVALPASTEDPTSTEGEKSESAEEEESTETEDSAESAPKDTENKEEPPVDGPSGN